MYLRTLLVLYDISWLMRVLVHEPLFKTCEVLSFLMQP